MAELLGQRFGFSQPEVVLQAQTQLAAVTAGSSGKSANTVTITVLPLLCY